MDTLVGMTQRYLTNPFVVANDLRNEIRVDTIDLLWPTWGDGNVDTDWKLAATTVADKMLAINPDLLIIIEGLNYANDMDPIKTDPITLSVENRMIYSFHYYSWQTSWIPLHNYDSFKAAMESKAVFMLEEGQAYTAPVWLGEFGTNTDDKYWTYLIRYLKENPKVHWAYWAYNGYQESP
jgi:endoglucanase